MEISEIVDFIFQLIGIIAFAVSGSLVALHKKTDIFGVVVLGVTTALGGGIIRDILIGHTPPRFFSDYRYVLAAFMTSLTVFIVAYILKNKFRQSEASIDRVNNIFDAIGLGVFTVAGAHVAMDSGFTRNGILVVCLGVITGVGGGILRDVMLTEIPFVLNKRIYAIASIIGGVLYYLLYIHNVNNAVSAIISVTVVFIIRILATVFEIDLPRVKFDDKRK